MKDLRKKTASGFAYKLAERVGAQGINFIIQLLLARILVPEEYGVISLVTVIITILDVFVTYGFGNSLIANKNSDSLDFSTCFYFGLVLAAVVYVGTFFGAPLIADFYETPVLTPLIRVMAIRVPLAAINSVQHAYVSKHMRFKKFFYATLIGTIISGVIAVVMAYLGCGVWSLVEQYLGNVLIDTLCLWIIVGWRPTKEFSFHRLKAIFAYGWKILAVGLIDTLYSRLRTLVIGKKYTKEDLAYYNRGYQFPSFGMRLIEPTVNTVLFPALSNCQDNQDEMRAITQKVIKVSTFIIYPIMVGLAAVAKPLVTVLLTEKWLPCVIYLQIGCLANLFRPQQFINSCVIKASGNSGLLLKLDIIKKAIGLVLLIVSMQFGVLWIAISLVATYLISMLINIAPNHKILNYGYWQQFKDVFGNLILALIMGACVYPLSFLKLNNVLLLVLQITVGVGVYVGLSLLTRNESLVFARQYVKKTLKDLKRKKNAKNNAEAAVQTEIEAPAGPDAAKNTENGPADAEPAIAAEPTEEEDHERNEEV